MSQRYKVLLLYSGNAPPREDAGKNMEYHISADCEGDLISTSWWMASEYRPEWLGPINQAIGNFRYHPLIQPARPLPGVLKFANNLRRYVRAGLELARERGGYDAIVTYGPYTCGLAGWIIRKAAKGRRPCLFVMLPAPPVESFKFIKGRLGKLKLWVSKVFVPSLLRSADAIWMLYPDQLEGMPPGEYPPQFIFPDFVPVAEIANKSHPVEPEDDRYIFFLGHPYDRKGVDLLIRAFQKITDKHPEVRLRIVGACPDLKPYEALAAGNPRIDFRKGVFHQEAMQLMERCEIFALPSRLEGVPRVIMEAMACSKPVVSSRIHGTPTVVADGVTGLLHEPEDVDGLADKLDRLLSDRALARQMGVAGRERILTDLSEQQFARSFRAMLDGVLQPKPT